MDLRRAFPIALALALAAACNGSSGSKDPGDKDPGETPPECTDAATAGCLVASSKQRITSPSVPEADLEATVAGNTEFAAGIYQQLRTEPGNLFYSPFSISAALAMTWAGAGGDTESKMAGVLHFGLAQSKTHPAFNAIDLALMSRGQGKAGADGGKFRLNVANALWGQMGYSFAAPFLDTLSLNYGAGMHVVDFQKSPEPSRKIINAWVADRTEDRIEDLLPEGSIDDTTRLVLTNAIYFNAAWETPFKPADTQEGTFTRRDGATTSVQMMSGHFDVGYGEGAGFAALELPYDGHELSMVLVLPKAGTLDDFETSFTGGRIADVVGSLSHHSVAVTLPRFKIESSFGLKKALTKLGMGIAFDQSADFSGMDGKGGLAISDVVHKAFVNLDEAGTEAAAATGVVVGVTSVPPPAEIHFDRTFVFFIRDIATKTVLFVGRVDNPQG